MSTPPPALFAPLGKQPCSLMKYAKALFLSAVSLNSQFLLFFMDSFYLSERKVEFWKPTFCPPAILIGMKNRNHLDDWDEK